MGFGRWFGFVGFECFGLGEEFVSDALSSLFLLCPLCFGAEELFDAFIDPPLLFFSDPAELVFGLDELLSDWLLVGAGLFSFGGKVIGVCRSEIIFSTSGLDLVN